MFFMSSFPLFLLSSILFPHLLLLHYFIGYTCLFFFSFHLVFRTRIFFIYVMTNDSTFICKLQSRCFAIMRDHGNFAFNLVVKLSVELGYVFLSLRL
jgi:hypothetical protein